MTKEEGTLETFLMKAEEIETDPFLKKLPKKDRDEWKMLRLLKELPDACALCDHSGKNCYSEKEKSSLGKNASLMTFRGAVFSITRYGKILCKECQMKGGYFDVWRHERDLSPREKIFKDPTYSLVKKYSIKLIKELEQPRAHSIFYPSPILLRD